MIKSSCWKCCFHPSDTPSLLFFHVVSVHTHAHLLLFLQFERSTRKFWVAPRHVLRLKLALVQHLPLLVYGRPPPEVGGDVTSVEAIKRGASQAAGLVSSGGEEDGPVRKGTVLTVGFNCVCVHGHSTASELI
jgi:hypothetical protein